MPSNMVRSAIAYLLTYFFEHMADAPLSIGVAQSESTIGQQLTFC
jgi:hypothetical protein